MANSFKSFFADAVGGEGDQAAHDGLGADGCVHEVRGDEVRMSDSIFDGIDFGDFGLGEFDLEGFDPEAFDLDPTEEPTETAIYTRPVVHSMQAVTYEHAEQFARDLRIDDETETFAFVSGNFIFGDFMEALVDIGKLSVKRMTIMTLSMNDENIDSIRNICEWEGVERLDVVLSDYWYAHELGGLVPYLFEELDLDGMELHVGFASVHCKTWCVETRNGHCLTVEGSANLRSSRNIEQVHISPDRGLFEFVTGFTENVIDAYDVVNAEARRSRKKSIRGGDLWQAVAARAAADGAGLERPKHAESQRHRSSEKRKPSRKGAGTTSTANYRSKG